MADNKIIIILAAKDSATSEIAAAVKNLEDSFKNLENSGTKSLDGISRGTQDNVASIAKWVAGIGAATLAFQGLKTAFAGGIKAAEDFNQVTIGIAATLTNLAAPGQGSFKNMFERNLGFAKTMYEELRKEDMNRASSLDEMMMTYNQSVQKGYAARVEEAKYIGIVTDKIKLATKGQETSVQINQELRALYEGQANAHSTIAQELKTRLGPAWHDLVEEHKKAGDLFKWLADLWPGIEAATQHTQNTIESQNSALMDSLKHVGREGLAGAYQDIVEILKQMNFYLAQHGDQLSKDIATAYAAVRDSVMAIPKALQSAVETAASFGKELNTISENPIIMAFLGAAAGGRFGPLGALVGGMLGGFKAADNIRQNAVDNAYKNAFSGYEEPMAEQTKNFISPLGQTAVKQTVDKFAGMNKDFMDRFKAMADAYRAMTGKEIEVTDGFRTFAQQADLYRRKPGLAARPGTSLHERGLAMDINTAQANELARLGLLETYGFNRPMLGQGKSGKNEPWHIEMTDYDAQAKQAQKFLSDQEKSAAKYQSYLDKLRKDDLKTAAKDAADAAGLANRLHDDGLKSYLHMINNKKALDRDARDWTASALQTIVQDEKLSYSDRLDAAKNFKELRMALLDEEIEQLKEKFGARLPTDMLEKYKVAMTDKIGADISKSTQDQSFSWEAAWKRAAENVQDAMSSMFESMFTGGDKKNIGKQFSQGLTKMISNQLTQGVMDGLNKLGGRIKGMFQASGKSPGADAADPAEKLGTAADNLNLSAMQGMMAAGSLVMAGIGVLTGSQELMIAAQVLAIAATALQIASAVSALPFFHTGGIVAHSGLLVAHNGLSLGPDERLIKAQTDEWILRRSATRALSAQGVSFGDLNSGRVSAGGGPTVINHTYAPTISHRMSAGDYNRDARKMWNAHERERRRRGR